MRQDGSRALAARLPEGFGRPRRGLQRGRGRGRPLDRRGLGRRSSGGRAARSIPGSRSPKTAASLACTGKCELGQGLFTAQAQLIAEELVVPLEPRHPRPVRHGPDPGPGHDLGRAVPSRELQPVQPGPGRGHGAGGARAARVGAAGRARGPAHGEGRRSSPSPRDPSRTASYGSLVGGRKFSHRRSIRTPGAGTPASGRCSASRCRASTFPPWPPGSSSSCTTCGFPGCCTGRSSGLPPWARRSWAWTSASVRDVPGLVKVVVKKNFVGVVAEKPWPARQAADKLKVTWSEGAGLPDPRDFHEYLRRQQPTRDTLLVDSKDVDAEAGARRDGGEGDLPASVPDARVPGHLLRRRGRRGATRPRSGRRRRRSTRTGTTAAMVLGLRPGERARHLPDGLRLLRAQRRRGRLLRRRAPVAGGRQAGPRPAHPQGRDGVGELRARLRRRPEGRPRRRRGRSWPGTARRGRRRSAAGPAPTAPATSSPGSWPASSRRRSRRAPAPDPESFNNGSNGVPSYVAGRVGARRGGTGTVESERVLAHAVRSPFWTGPLRSPQRLQNTFAHECFLDELAQRVKADPRRLPAEAPPRPAAPPRADHGRPGPRAGRRGPRRGRARGRNGDRRAAGASPACSYEGDNGYCAMVAEVEVDQDGRRRRGEAPRRRPRLRARVEPGRRSGTRSRAAPSRA